MSRDIMPWAIVRGTSVGVVLALMPGMESCRDTAAPSEGAPEAADAPAIVSDPIAPHSVRLIGAAGALLDATVAYVSLRPGTFASGITATIVNQRTSATLTLGLVGGGLDPVPIAADVGDTLGFAVDTGAFPAIRFSQVVPRDVQATVVRTEPPAGARDVPLNSRVRVIFSEPVDPASVTDNTIRLEQGGAPVDGEIDVSADGLEAGVTPGSGLLPETEYTLVVGDGVRDTDGSQLDQVVTVRFTTGSLSPPPTSAQGSLAFTGADGDIHLIAVHGTGLRDLTADGPINSFDTDVAWSPDGGRLAFTRFDGDYTAGIYVIDADGTDLVRLSPPGVYDAHPTWAPDGSRIAFEHREDVVSGGQIFRMDADGGNRVQLTRLGQPPSSPAWSPDGRRIAFSAFNPVSGSEDIHVMDADGSNIAPLISDGGYDGEPAWAPDGRRVAFQKDAVGGLDLFIVDSDGSHLTRLTIGASAGQPSWSPGGEFIAFTHYDPGCDLTDWGCRGPYLRAVRVADGQLYEIPADGEALNPGWQP